MSDTTNVPDRSGGSAMRAGVPPGVDGDGAIAPPAVADVARPSPVPRPATGNGAGRNGATGEPEVDSAAGATVTPGVDAASAPDGVPGAATSPAPAAPADVPGHTAATPAGGGSPAGTTAGALGDTVTTPSGGFRPATPAPAPASGPVPSPGPGAAPPPPWRRMPQRDGPTADVPFGEAPFGGAPVSADPLDDVPTAFVEPTGAPGPSADPGASRPAGAERGRVSGAWASMRTRSRPPRRAALQLKRLDPWSVLKLALVLSGVLFLIFLVAVGILYGVLDAMGLMDRLNGTYADLVSGDGSASGEPLISAWRVLGYAALIGGINSVLFAVALTVGAFVYNACADLVGGVEVTLSERD